MLTIQLKAVELFNDETNEFISLPAITLELEHSLVSLSKWESEWEKPFLTADEKTDEETFSYIKAMTLTLNVPPEVYTATRLTPDVVSKVNEYMSAKKSATWFNERPGRKPPSRETLTSELIYYWMFSATIPKECETWHLSRLFTLIKVFQQKNAPAKKMSRQEQMQQQRELNARRLAQHNTRG